MTDREDMKGLLPSMANNAVAVCLLVILGLLTWNSGRSGYASLLTTYAAQSSQIDPANAAVNLSASNPDAHYVRATILVASDLDRAIAEYKQAALARPDDYVLWLSLARAHELNGDTAAAITAARQAVPLAPDYAEPHYQLGNILLRAGQTEEGFKELRLAGASNPTLLPGIVDLAWRISGNNAQFVVAAMAPETPAAYQMLAQFFGQHKQADAAIAMYAAAGTAAARYRRAYLGDLIAAKYFKEAARLWAVGRQTGALPGVMINRGFEEESDLNEPGFAWRLGDKPDGFRLSLDTADSREGHSSLKIDFDGAPNPASPVITQLILVEPRARYQLRFAVRSEGLVSGGLPRVVVRDAETDAVLAQSDPFPATTGGWHDYTIDFEAGNSASAVQIGLQRQSCEKPPCPIFGRLWLDNFSLQKL